MQTFIDYLYECIYSAGILAGVIMAGHFTAERRFQKFWVTVVSWIVTFLIGGCFSFLSSNMQDSDLSLLVMQVLHMLWYFSWVIVLFFVTMLNYKGTVQQLIFTFALGYLMDTSAFGFFRLSYDFGWLELRVNTWYSVLAEVLFMAFCYVAFYFVFKKVFKERNYAFDRIPFTIAYLATIVLTMFLRMSLQYVYEFVYQTTTGWIVNLSIGLVPVVFLTLVLLLYSFAVASNEKQV